MTISKKDIEKTLAYLDEDVRESFLAMDREQQLLVILGMEGSNSNRLALVERWQINFEMDQRSYRQKREEMETNGGDEVANITGKILSIIAQEKAKSFNVGVYLRDKVLPTIISTAFLAIIVVMGLFLSGKLSP